MKARRAGGTSRGRRAAAFVAVGAGLVLAVGIVWLLLEGTSGRVGVTEPTWHPGARQRHALEIDSRVALVVPARSGPEARVLEQRLRADLHLRVFALEGGDLRVGFQLDDVDYGLAGGSVAGMEAGLSVPFLVRFEPNGRPVAFEFPDGLDASPAALLEEIVRTFQLVRAPDRSPVPTGGAWSVGEGHSLGRYLAYYERRPDGVFLKRKTRYTRPELPVLPGRPAPTGAHRGPTGEIRVVRSDARFRLAEGVAWVERAELEERAVFTVAGRRLGDAEVSARLELESTSPEAAVALYDAGDWSAIRLAASEALRQSQRGGAALASQRSIDDWTEALDAPTGERVRARAALEEALRERPELAREVADAVRSVASAEAAASLIHALERVGSPGSQAALVDLARDGELRRLRRLQSVVALGGVEQATEGTVDALLDLSRSPGSGDLASTALLAVGAIGHTLREQGVSRSTGLGEELHGSLRDAHQAKEVGVALKAMGNMGDPEFAETVAPYVDHASPYVRASAAWALERAGASDESRRLADRLALEEDGRVRAALVSALSALDEGGTAALDLVTREVVDEPRPDVRMAMVTYLSMHLDDRARIRDTLAWLALRDDSGAVRRRAADVLAEERRNP